MYKVSFKLLGFFSIGAVLAYGNAVKNNVEVTAKHVEGTGTSLLARDGVVVSYRGAVIHADKAIYNKKTHKLTLDGNVEMIGYKGTKEHTSHLEINTETDKITFKELFFTNENDIWLMSNEAVRAKSIYTFGASMLSSCDINDPLWKMLFSRSIYDSEEEYMKIYDASLYFGPVPVFYTPYLAFSTNNNRSSGLLFPLFGYTRDEGFVYEQPIFWAINPSMDIEINPQIRTDRSLGLYGTFRFADSPHSQGRLRVGYFKDNDSYITDHQLTDSEHYGLEFLYDSSKVISDLLPQGYTDELYANITLLNDIEYLNLQKTHLQHFGQVPLQESRINYFLHNDSWYAGLNAKYFIDTRLSNNDETQQTLPALQFHKYLKSIFVDNLTYSLDLQSKRIDRKEGATLNQVEFRLPIEFTASFLDDYIHVTLGEYLYFGKFFLGNDDTLTYNDFQYHNNIHHAKIFSDLTGKFGDLTHVLQPAVSYTKPGSEGQSPVAFDTLLQEQPQTKDLFSVGLPEEQVLFSLSQYFYDDAMRLVFFQRFSQTYYPDREKGLAELRNEMEYDWDGWSLYNNIVYSFVYDSISESSSSISLKEKDYRVSVGHTYKKRFTDLSESVTANDISFNFTYAYNERVALEGGLIYNLEDSSSKLWRFGGSYTRDCWSIAASVSADVRPRPTSVPGVKDYTQEYGFFVQLNFIPFASINTAQIDSMMATP